MVKLTLAVIGCWILVEILRKMLTPKPVVSDKVSRYARYTIDKDGTLNYRKE